MQEWPVRARRHREPGWDPPRRSAPSSPRGHEGPCCTCVCSHQPHVSKSCPRPLLRRAHPATLSPTGKGTEAERPAAHRPGAGSGLCRLKMTSARTGPREVPPGPGESRPQTGHGPKGRAGPRSCLGLRQDSLRAAKPVPPALEGPGLCTDHGASLLKGPGSQDPTRCRRPSDPGLPSATKVECGPSADSCRRE